MAINTSAAPPNKIALVLIYNHRYDKNIERLESIYKGRFQNIFHVMPFYIGDCPNVIGVYENSHQFQGYFTQSLPRIYQESFTHYIYCADDLILNPNVNEHNILDRIGLQLDQAYIQDLKPISSVSFDWLHLQRTVKTILDSHGVEPFSELPAPEDARQRLEVHGIKAGRIGWKNLWSRKGFYRQLPASLQLMLEISVRRVIRPQRLSRLQFPFLLGYSDLIIVPGSSIQEFCRLCGIFATMRVFVEIAAPTALALACSSVATAVDIKMRSREMWSLLEVAALEDQCDRELGRLADTFKDDLLYVHPVKLSRWKGAFV